MDAVGSWVEIDILCRAKEVMEMVMVLVMKVMMVLVMMVMMTMMIVTVMTAIMVS